MQNPQADLQAQDRCHRIGQTRPVLILRLITASTIDERIVERAATKRKLEKLIIQSGKFKASKQSDRSLDKVVDSDELVTLLSQRDHERIHRTNTGHGKEIAWLEKFSEIHLDIIYLYIRCSSLFFRIVICLVHFHVFLWLKWKVLVYVIFSTFLFFPLMYIYLYISHFSVYKGRAKSITRQKWPDAEKGRKGGTWTRPNWCLQSYSCWTGWITSEWVLEVKKKRSSSLSW